MLIATGATQPQVIALYKDLIGLQDKGSADYHLIPSDPLVKRELTLSAMSQQLTTMATESPVLVILEDAHWMDSTSLELVSMIVEKVSRIPVLTVITSRPEFKAPWIGQANVTTITLGRLGERHATELVEKLMNEIKIPRELLTQIAIRRYHLQRSIPSP